jgi:hypothetical protein
MEEAVIGPSASEFAPEAALRHLGGDAGRLWRDPLARRQALVDLLTAWAERDDGAVERAVGRIDAAIVAGLQAVGLPRGSIDGITLDVFGRGWRGRKLATCMLLLDAFLIDRCVRAYGAPDDVFRTWLHESIHARQPFAPSFRAESRLAAGYEEGLAEGLARRIIRAQPGMQPVEHTYGRYVAAYEALAARLDCPPDLLWRRLWAAPAGAVRAVFPGIVGDLWLTKAGRRLGERQRILLSTRADVVFSSSQALTDHFDVEQLDKEWARVLR